MKKDDDNNQTFATDAVIDSILQVLGRVLNVAAVYGEKHQVTLNMLDEAYDSLEEFFSTRTAISLGAFQGSMTVDGRPVHVTGALKKGLEKRLVNLHITGLKISKGITRDEFRRLVDMLNQGEEEAFKKALASSGIEHIGSEETTYQPVRKDEKVVAMSEKKSRLSGMDDEINAYFEAQQRAANSGAQVQQIVAFLKGDVGGSSEAQSALAEVANDPAKLAELILESTAVRSSAQTLQGETLADVVLGCLRKTYDSLKIQPDYQGEKGQESLKKAMLLLERSVLDRMRSYFGASDPIQDERIKNAVRSMNEDMELEMLAASFMGQRDAVRKSTEKIVSYIKERGVDQAKTQFGAADLSPAEWRKMVVQSKRPDGSGTGSGGGDAEFSLGANLGTLGMVLEKLEALMRTDHPAQLDVASLVEKAEASVSGLTECTEKKINSLSEIIQGDMPEEKTIGGSAINMRASDLLATLAEIAQELAQPLTAINTSLEMVLNGYVGEVSEEQKSLLTLANGSGEHMHYLMDQLQAIVGYPTNLGVDKRFSGKSADFVELLPPDPKY
jgi:hypothetical protein